MFLGKFLYIPFFRRFINSNTLTTFLDLVKPSFSYSVFRPKKQQPADLSAGCRGLGGVAIYRNREKIHGDADEVSRH